ncbi:hypothetical protein N8T08_001205 [Aspergillus melleus]|uniref:Uncharacterized protein n=1 Tax=Aspergillus melleus TaxID=138277 RepID=A0ACC3ANQ6_9EURO|nr:hypothetical protein N8T08_001205 [Aspergillus melleus]
MASSIRPDSSTSSTAPPDNGQQLEPPIIEDTEPLADVVRKLYNFITLAVSDVSYTFEQLRSTPHGQHLRHLIYALAENSHNPSIIAALMILKWEFDNTTDADWGLNESRGYACEYVAWQFLCHLDQRETIEFLLEEIQLYNQSIVSLTQAERGTAGFTGSIEGHNRRESETIPLLQSSSPSVYNLFGGRSRVGSSFAMDNQGSYGSSQDAQELERFSLFFGLNALEIATIAHAKTFLGQKVVQRVIDNIWKGEIVFWDTLSVHSTKRPHFLDKRTADPYSRLRVPVYRKAFEAAFFVSFLLLYYAVLVERKSTGIGLFETLMYFWIAAFAYDEFSGMADAGMLFYQMDFWKVWNMGIIGTGLAFVITRIIGLAQENDYITDLSFDILSLEALFLVPRLCSLVSLNSYFGSLIPVLKEMTKAFFRFIPVVVVLYIGKFNALIGLDPGQKQMSVPTVGRVLDDIHDAGARPPFSQANVVDFGEGVLWIERIGLRALFLNLVESVLQN